MLRPHFQLVEGGGASAGYRVTLIGLALLGLGFRIEIIGEPSVGKGDRRTLARPWTRLESGSLILPVPFCRKNMALRRGYGVFI